MEECYSGVVPKVLNIKNEEAYRLALQIAELKGESLTQAVLRSLQERLGREIAGPQDDIADRLLEIGRQLAKEPVYDTRSTDAILGYDEYGIPR
jgi:antitoxin VapB